MNEWFAVQCIYKIESSLYETNEEDEEDELLKSIRYKNSGAKEDYEFDIAYLNLIDDPIANLLPYCIFPKGANNKKYLTQIVLASGNTLYAIGKPESIYEKLIEQKFLPKNS